MVKGSLLYHYIINVLNLEIENNSEELEQALFNIVEKMNAKDECCKYDCNFDISKIILQALNIKVRDNIDLLKTINQLLEFFISNNENKVFIIFYDSSILDFELENYENVYTFDISNICYYQKYNLICTDDIHEIDMFKLKEEIKEKFPIIFDDDFCNKKLSLYFRYFNKGNPILVINQKDFLFFSYLKKYINPTQQIIQSGFVIDDKFKYYLTIL